MSKTVKFLYITVCVLLTGYICSLAVMGGQSEWYNAAQKPIITPPAFVFSTAWSLIYALLIASTYMVLSKVKDKTFFRINLLFVLQLVFQTLWCVFFFTLGEVGLGLAAFILLDFIVFWMAISYKKVNKTAYYILIPYYLWLAFATLLNALFLV